MACANVLHKPLCDTERCLTAEDFETMIFAVVCDSVKYFSLAL